MSRGKSNRDSKLRSNERGLNRGGRQNVTSQRGSSMEENNQRSESLKGRRSQTDPTGRIRSEESDRSE